MLRAQQVLYVYGDDDGNDEIDDDVVDSDNVDDYDNDDDDMRRGLPGCGCPMLRAQQVLLCRQPG